MRLLNRKNKGSNNNNNGGGFWTDIPSWKIWMFVIIWSSGSCQLYWIKYTKKSIDTARSKLTQAYTTPKWNKEDSEETGGGGGGSTVVDNVLSSLPPGVAEEVSKKVLPPAEKNKSARSNGATGERFGGHRVRKFEGPRRGVGSLVDPSSSTSTPTRTLFFRRSTQKKKNQQQQQQQEKEQQTKKDDAAKESLHQYLTNQPLFGKCQHNKWAVVTTIFGPSEATKLIIDSPEMKEEWCLVVVADTKTPQTYMADAGCDNNNNNNNNNHRVVFLSVADQQQLAKLVPFVKLTPFQSFSRKNIGYLYAIWMGATVIFDFDDDNVIKTKLATNNEALWSGTELLEMFAGGGGGEEDTTSTNDDYLLAKQISVSNTFEGRAFNPFPVMGATIGDAWPRGLPLSLINEKESRGQPGPLLLKDLKRSNVAVIQSTADHDPDVDAIFRLSRSLPFEFERSKTKAFTIEIPQTKYSPYNAQATLHYPIGFWGMYLPMTVTGRVSDIWRSYIVQRLLKELQEPGHVLYSPPMVTQFRNSHDYLADFTAEQHLFLRTEALLEYLDSWTPTTIVPDNTIEEDNLQNRIEDLWIGLYERQFVEMEDVKAIQEWLNALEQGGYVFPKVRDHSRSFDVSRGGVAARQECARQQLENWKEPTPTMMNGTNLGALFLLQRGPQDPSPQPKKSIARLLAEYEVEHPFPHSVDLICRTGTHHGSHEIAILIESIQLYWPKCAGRIILVLDRGEEEFARKHIPSWIDVLYSEFAYGMPGRLGNQLFNMYSDHAGPSEYHATIDSDVALTTPVTPDLIFNLNKKDEAGRFPPYVLTDTKYQAGYWSKGDRWMFKGDSNDWNFMMTLPIVFPRDMFPQYRAGVEAIHGNEFETTDLWEHFRRTVRLGWMAMSQFCLLGNWMVRHWKDAPFDLRKETDAPTIRYGVHLPYHKGIDFRPRGQKDPASFQAAGRRVITEGVCELFCSNHGTAMDNPAASSRALEDSSVPMATLETCSSLCPQPVPQPRSFYFSYQSTLYGTPEERDLVLGEHFKPLRSALASLAQKSQEDMIQSQGRHEKQ